MRARLYTRGRFGGRSRSAIPSEEGVLERGVMGPAYVLTPLALYLVVLCTVEVAPCIRLVL
eukprot:2647009-Pyramimonas_sp.AAC.1